MFFCQKVREKGKKKSGEIMESQGILMGKIVATLPSYTLKFVYISLILHILDPFKFMFD